MAKLQINMFKVGKIWLRICVQDTGVIVRIKLEGKL